VTSAVDQGGFEEHGENAPPGRVRKLDAVKEKTSGREG